MRLKILRNSVVCGFVSVLLSACASTNDGASRSDGDDIVVEVEEEFANESEIGGSGSLSETRRIRRVRLSRSEQEELARQGNAPNIAPIARARADYCPKIEILNGTGVLTAYRDGGSASLEDITHQANITRSGRECSKQNEFLTIRVGAAGRAVKGPKLVKNDVSLPIRVAVLRNDTEVLFSRMYSQNVNFTSAAAQGFSFVEENLQIPFPELENLKILIGFDVVSDPDATSTQIANNEGEQ